MPADAAPLRFRLEDLLAEGHDPPSTLLSAATSLPPGGLLILDAPFDPAPLRHLLGSHGLDAQATVQTGGRWHLHVRRGEAIAADAQPQDDSRTRFWLEDGRLTLDLRGLPPPRPMMEILRMIDGGLAGGEMAVHVPHIPVHLFPDLEERGWSWEVLTDTDDGTCLLLTREDTP